MEKNILAVLIVFVVTACSNDSSTKVDNSTKSEQIGAIVCEKLFTCDNANLVLVKPFLGGNENSCNNIFKDEKSEGESCSLNSFCKYGLICNIGTNGSGICIVHEEKRVALWIMINSRSA